jgi:transcriptional regulator with PAS, ATPase and Fis domain
MPEALLESELFGHERGAFTGAHKARAGLLEAADGGTLFFDEIGEMPLTTQAKLLRAVETRTVTRIGSVRPVALDVRFVAATNRDLVALVEAGTFREDLYFRLNGVTVHVPPLRERPRDIELLARHFAARAAREMKRALATLSPEAIRVLEEYPWPGNVRELKSVVERALTFAGSSATLGPEHFPELRTSRPSRAPAPVTAGLRGEVHAFEKQRIVDALEQCAGNQTRAAEMLGISRRTLLHRLDAYGLPRPRK